MKYLNIRRLELAKELLTKEPNTNITEIAYSCGFTSSQYFATLFKKYEKCTPNEYKAMELNHS